MKAGRSKDETINGRALARGESKVESSLGSSESICRKHGATARRDDDEKDPLWPRLTDCLRKSDTLRAEPQFRFLVGGKSDFSGEANLKFWALGSFLSFVHVLSG